MKIQLQSADSKSKPKSTLMPQTFDSGVKVEVSVCSIQARPLRDIISKS